MHGMRNLHTACSACHGMQCARFNRVWQLDGTLLDGSVSKDDLYNMTTCAIVNDVCVVGSGACMLAANE